jgi:hypothetical protein
LLYQGGAGLPVCLFLPAAELAQGQIAAQGDGVWRGLQALSQVEGRREPVAGLRETLDLFGVLHRVRDGHPAAVEQFVLGKAQVD